MDLDRRYCAGEVRLSGSVPQDDEGKQYPSLEGYAAVFFNPEERGSEFKLDEDFYERIIPGAFSRALKEGDSVAALFNHNPDYIIGRSTAGTLKLSQDSKGLRYVVDPPENAIGKYVTMAVERGDVTASSFAFVVDEQVLRTEQRDGREVLIREIHSLHLYDISPVVYPAYSSTSVGLSSRSLAVLNEFRSKAKGTETRNGFVRDLLMRKRAWDISR